MMNKLTLIAMGIALSLPVFTSTVRAQGTVHDTVAASLLFVQSAKGMSYDHEQGTLTLQEISPAVTFFTDRPQRIAGHVLLTTFLKAWDEGRDSFEKDPPNAELSILREGSVESAVVELRAPKLNRGNLVYQVKVMDGKLPASGGTCSLFIDGAFYGAARGAAGGAIIGAACGDAGKGAAVGAAVGGVTGAARTRRAMTYQAGRAAGASQAQAQVQATPVMQIVNVPNSNGSYTPVTLKQVPGGWQGPKGEVYPTMPNPDQLKPTYGL